jgi:hypothetical protein
MLTRVQVRALRMVINDASTLRGLNEMSTMNVPLQPPSSWPAEWYKDYTDFDVCTYYEHTAHDADFSIDHQAVSRVRNPIGPYRVCHFTPQVTFCAL